MLRRYLYVLGAPRDLLEDLLQQTLALAIERRRDLSPTDGPWLRTTAKHMLLREWTSRRRRREVELADELWREEHADDERDDDRVAALRACTEMVPARSRSLLRRTYLDGHGRAATGAELGMTASGVKTALRRLRDELRKCVERRLGGTR